MRFQNASCSQTRSTAAVYCGCSSFFSNGQRARCNNERGKKKKKKLLVGARSSKPATHVPEKLMQMEYRLIVYERPRSFSRAPSLANLWMDRDVKYELSLGTGWLEVKKIWSWTKDRCIDRSWNWLRRNNRNEGWIVTRCCATILAAWRFMECKVEVNVFETVNWGSSYVREDKERFLSSFPSLFGGVLVRYRDMKGWADVARIN